MLMSQGEHVTKANVLLSPNIMNEGLTLHTCGEGVDDTRIGDFLKLILALRKALDIIM